MDIIALLQVLSQCLDRTSVRRLSVIVSALLSMTGRVTMLGICCKFRHRKRRDSGVKISTQNE